uniref:Outer dense fiber of sperm tails 3 like 2 n=2 Tax=Papio anubis TaxID=9555 RepID=A0A8I5NPB1_PAPAN
MGTLSCDPAPRLATAPLGRRVTEGQIPETGLRKSCGTATLENGSGPGLYVLPSTVGFINHDCTRVASPAYSLVRRPSEAPPQDTSPGPIYFLDPKVTRFGRSCTPAYSMQGRAKSRGEYPMQPHEDLLSGVSATLLPCPPSPSYPWSSSNASVFGVIKSKGHGGGATIPVPTGAGGTE